MSNYTKTTNFATKDSLASGNPNKIVKGTEINSEFDNIATAVATKANTASPSLTGTVTAAALNVTGNLDVDGTLEFDSISGTGSVAVTDIADEDNMSSNSATKLATQQSIKAYVDSQVTAQDLDLTDGSTSISIDLDSEALSVLGGTGVTSTASGNGVTLAIDSTVTTLTGSQTLTNKTLTSPDVNTPDIDGGTIDGTVIGGATAAAGSFTTVGATGNITVGGTVDGRDVATDGSKLDGIEASATADQSNAEIRTAVEAATDSNVFTDADHSKLNAIEASATADQTDAEIRAAVEAATDSNVFTDADHTKLNAIEASADVTDTTNVTAAGALMDSELTAIASVKALNQGVATGDSPTFVDVTATSLDISGNIDVDGVTNLDVVDIDGAVDMASTLAVGGLLSANASINVTGDITLGDTNPTITFNDSSVTNLSHAVFSASNNLRLTSDVSGVDSGSRVEIFDGSTEVARFSAGAVLVTGEVAATSLDISGDIDVDGTTNLDVVDIDGAVDMASTLAVGGVVTANAGVVVDNFTLDGTTLALSSGSMTLDSASQIILDADGGLIQLKDGGTEFAQLKNSSSDLQIISIASDKDIIFRGNAGGSYINALTLDMSDAGTATFNHHIKLSATNRLFFDGGSNTYIQESASDDLRFFVGGSQAVRVRASGTDILGAVTADAITVDNITIDGNEIDVGSGDLTLDVAGDIILDADGGDVFFYDAGSTFGQVSKGGGSDLIIGSTIADKDIFFTGIDSSTAITALTLDMSAAGAATFSSSVSVAGVGVIGATDGDLNIYSTAASHSGLRLGNGYVAPTNNAGTITNDAISLGLSGQRFTNLYLSDSVQNSGKAGSATVFNEDATSADFRVESASETHMLFVDGGLNAVGIGTSAAGSFTIKDLVVGDGTGARGVTIYAATDNESIIRFADGTSGDQQYRGQIKYNHAEDSLNFHANGASSSAENLILKTSEAVFNEGGIDTDFRVESSGNANMLFVDAGNDRIGVGTAAPDTLLHLSGADTAVIRLENTDTSLGANQLIGALEFEKQDGSGAGAGVFGGIRMRVEDSVGANAYMTFSTGWSSGMDTERVRIQSSGGFLTNPIAGGHAVFNDGGIDADFRVESDGNENMLFVDGGNNQVFIGASSASALNTFGDDLVVVNTTAGTGAGISIIANATNGYSNLYFGDTADGDIGRVQYNHGDNSMTFRTNTADALVIASTGAATFSSTIAATSATFTNADNSANLTLVSTDTDAASGPVLDMWRNSANPADGDAIGEINYYGENDAGEQTKFANIISTMVDVSDGTEDGAFYIQNMVAGTMRERISMLATETIVNNGSRDLDFRVESDGNANMLFVDGGNNRIVIGSATANANDSAFFDTNGILSIARTSGTGRSMIDFRNAGASVGTVTTSASATQYNTSSDQRLKDNIADADDAGNKIDAIQVRKYDWKADGSHQDYGMIAQELQAVAPEAVSTPENPDEMMGVDYSKLVPMLIKEIQSLRQRVAQLEE